MIVTRTISSVTGSGVHDWADLQTAVKRMIDAGVKIGVGCDSGIPFIPYGECVHTEMELLTEVGYSPLQAITAATGGNAEMMGTADKVGTIMSGKAADLVVLGGNPLDDIRKTRDIKLVLRDGEVVVDHLFGGDCPKTLLSSCA
jgi:imidazolonepropionase-like amidohydrolase